MANANESTNTYFVYIGQTIIGELGSDNVSCFNFEKLGCVNSLFLNETNVKKVTETIAGCDIITAKEIPIESKTYK